MLPRIGAHQVSRGAADAMEVDGTPESNANSAVGTQVSMVLLATRLVVPGWCLPPLAALSTLDSAEYVPLYCSARA